jgi:hypothetical protein
VASSGAPAASPPGEPAGADGHAPPGGALPRRVGRRLRLSPRRAARRLAEPLLTLAAGLAASVPVIASGVRAVRDGWVPLADRGIIATRAHDVLTSHPPLVGQYTLAGEVTGHVTHSLGPMLFWLLSLPAYLGSTVGMTVVMTGFNTLCIVGFVALARRRGGRVLMVLAALAVALMCQSLAAETFHDVWNPSAGLFPLTLLVFLCWSLACGEYRLLPLTVLVASFVAQVHLAYLPPALALLAVGLFGLAAGSIARRRRGGTRPRRRTVLVWGLATMLVAALCWSPTVVGQLTEHPGNLTLVAEAASKRKATLGASVGSHAVVHAVGVVPWWLQTPASRWQRKWEVRSSPGALAADSTVLLLAALAALVLLGLVGPGRRRRRDLAALALLALALCPALGAVAAATPTPPLLSATLGYTLWWGSVVGMVVWLTLAWALWSALVWAARGVADAARGRRVRAASSVADPPPGSRTRRLATPRAAPVSVACTLLAIAAVAFVGAAVAAEGKTDEHSVLFKPVAAIDAHLAHLIPRGGTVLFEGSLDGPVEPAKPAVRFFLVARSTRVLAPGSSLRLGGWYNLDNRPYREAIYLSDTPSPPAAHVRLVFRTAFRENSTLNTVYLWLSRAPGPARVKPSARGALVGIRGLGGATSAAPPSPRPRRSR